MRPAELQSWRAAVRPRLQSDMNFPSDPETGVCLSGGLASLSRQVGVRSQTDGRGYTDPGDTREEGNIGSLITMLITDQVRKYDSGVCLLYTSSHRHRITVSESHSLSM